ncbi:MAG TPA: RES domain-containing protein [Thermoanaerobaculia bacterium]|nr:RES domain-containing protein [Thermoanaerobaculia bacterium]
MLTAYRIVKARYADDAFAGIASRRHGGRWNPPGIPIVYTSATISLAALETLAHIESTVLNEFVVIQCWFPEVLVEAIELATLPDGWSAVPPPATLQQIGYEWFTRRTSAVLQVPSVVVDGRESNYLLNPEHEDFRSIDIGSPQPFLFDYRLFT